MRVWGCDDDLMHTAALGWGTYPGLIYVTVWVCEDGDGESVSGEGVGM